MILLFFLFQSVLCSISQHELNINIDFHRNISDEIEDLTKLKQKIETAPIQAPLEYGTDYRDDEYYVDDSSSDTSDSQARDDSDSYYEREFERESSSSVSSSSSSDESDEISGNNRILHARSGHEQDYILQSSSEESAEGFFFEISKTCSKHCGKKKLGKRGGVHCWRSGCPRPVQSALARQGHGQERIVLWPLYRECNQFQICYYCGPLLLQIWMV